MSFPNELPEKARQEESGESGAVSTPGRSRYARAVICILCSALGFAVMNLLIRLSGDLPTVQKAFFRNFVAFLLALIVLWRGARRGAARQKTWDAGAEGLERVGVWPKGQGGWLFLRSLFGTLGILCNFYAVDHLAIADASVLNKLSPFFALLFSWLFLREKIRPPQMLAIALAFLGVVVIAEPGGSLVPTLPLLAGICGGISAGAAYTLVRFLGQRGVAGAFIVCYFSGFSCLVLLIPMILFYKPMSPEQVALLVGTGLAAGVGQFGITFAYKSAPAREISIFDYSMVLFSALLGYAFIAEIPGLSSWIGYALVFFGTLLSYLYNRRKAAAERRET